MRFMHIADIHLGNQQYGLKARFNDFSKVFLHLADEAVKRRVDFVLLAGDLFDKRTVEPLVMRVAIAVLTQLQAQGIPVLAVEGNHEKAYYREQDSWMDFLDALAYVKLLTPTFEGGRPVLERYSADGGAYVDLPGGVRVYGVKYYGAATSKVVRGVAEAMSELDHNDVRYTILMMHAGLEGQLAHMGRLKYDDLAHLRDHVDYLALGHIHKPYIVDDWIYNPGSPETCGVDECAWPDRGCYIVDITPDHHPKHRVEHLVPKRRPFHRCRLDLDGMGDANAVYDAVRALVRREDPQVPREPQPVVDLSLTGMLPFDRYALDLEYIQSLLVEAWNPLLARVRNLTTPAEFEIRLEEESSRPELERAIVQELLERDTRYRDAAADWTAGALDLKRMVLDASDPDTIIHHLRQLREDLSGPASRGATSQEA